MKKKFCILITAILIFTLVLSASAADPVPVTAVTLSEESINLPVKKSMNLKATIEPKNATNKKLVWTSSDETVATVKNGKVTGVSAGKAVITVTTEDGTGPSAVADVTVVQPVKKIKIEGDQIISLPPKYSWRLTATAEPADASIKTVEWSSSNAGVASVDEKGVVTGVSTGEAVITAVSVDGSKLKASIKVKVCDFDLIFTEKGSKKVSYTFGSGMITVKGSVKTGCVRMSDVDTSILALIGKETETEDVTVYPVKPGADTITISVNAKKFVYKAFVCPEVFPETGLAATDAGSNKTEDLLFMGIPWGSSYEEAKAVLSANKIYLKPLTKRNDYLRTQIKSDYVIADCTATNSFLNFSYKPGEENYNENNTFFEGEFYFDKEVPIEQIELAVRTFYGLPQGEYNDGVYTWKQGKTILTLEQKERFSILVFSQVD